MANNGLILSSQSDINEGFDENDETLINPDSDSEHPNLDPYSSDSDTSNESITHSSSNYEPDHAANPHACNDWINNLPSRHQGIANALNTMMQYCIKYLITSEERTSGIVKEFEKKGRMVVEKLKEMHLEDWNEFVERYNEELGRVREVCGGVEGEMEGLWEGWRRGKLVREVKEDGRREWEGVMEALRGLEGR